MNVTQHKSPGRFADLSRFNPKAMAETPKPLLHVRNPGCREFFKGETQTDAGYGCVDWYQYADRAEGGARDN
jgi:hypothetical protein